MAGADPVILYTLADMDRLARVPTGTAARWLNGYARRSGDQGGRYDPVAGSPAARGQRGTYLDLIEVVVIGQLKARGFHLPTVRLLVANCRELLNVERPLVTLNFKTAGRDVFVQAGAHLVEVGRHRGTQAWNEVLGPFLMDLDYADEMVSGWWPQGRDGHVQITPSYGFGHPVVEDTGVRTEIIRELFEAGEPLAEIAADFELPGEQVEAALRYELRVA